MSPEEKSEYDTELENTTAERLADKQDQVARLNYQPPKVTSTPAALGTDLQLVPVATTTEKLQPHSCMLWHQQPDADPINHILGTAGTEAASSSRPINAQTLSKAIPDLKRGKLLEAANEFRSHNESAPKAHPEFPEKVKYPEQCGALCKKCPPRRFRLGMRIIDAMKLAVKAIGGFKNILRADLVCMFCLTKEDDTRMTFYGWIINASGTPQSCDLHLLQPLIDRDDDESVSNLPLTYARHDHISPLGFVPPGLESEAGMLQTFTDDEFAEMLVRVADDAHSATIAILDGLWVDIDVYVCSGVAHHKLAPVVVTDSEDVEKPNKCDKTSGTRRLRFMSALMDGDDTDGDSDGDQPTTPGARAHNQ